VQLPWLVLQLLGLGRRCDLLEFVQLPWLVLQLLRLGRRGELLEFVQLARLVLQLLGHKLWVGHRRLPYILVHL
jgi:hypothetical protein